MFGPAPRPVRDVDPDVIESIIFGPQPRPHGYVDPDFVAPVIFGPPPRPDNYIELADIDNLGSMEDDTIHGGFHEESPVGPNDAPTPTADAAGRAEDPTLLTSLSAKLDRCMGRIDSLETELGTSKKIMGGAILILVSRVKKLERTVKQLKTARFGGDAPVTEGAVNIQDDVDLEGLSRMASEALGHDPPAVPSEDIEEREEEEVPLRRKRSAHRRARTAFSTPAFEQFQAHFSAGPSVAADKGKAPMPELDIPAEFLAEDAQARQRLEEEQASERLVQRLQAEDLAKGDLPNVSAERAKELDDLMMRMTETDWLNLMMQVGSNPALARELLGADVTEANFVERMTAIKERKKRALAAGNCIPRALFMLTVPPSYCRDVVVAGSVIQTIQDGLRESYECLASAPIACTARQMVFSSPWLTAKQESGSPLQTALVCNSNPLMVTRAVTNSCCKDWKLLFFNVAACFVAAGYLVSAGTCFCCYSILLLREDLSRNLELTESKPIVPAGSSSSIPADYVSAGHVLVSADRDRIC
ncbi:hypothetical protein Tco_0196310 [Tanacetum coccineum]